ncbi:MAG: peptide chain release factor N(5)-glutamine methyltransferase [Prevotella sp.]|nr:peptide chain release factor N(5)-glutamine methyltransferase [Prevotella sp.]
MTYREFWHKLLPIYHEHEAKEIARLIYEEQFGLSFADICMGKDTDLSVNEVDNLQKILARLLTYEPVQYILGKETFKGREFVVNSDVLIPRPETEELCDWILANFQGRTDDSLQILDIGTGSGCIAITLAIELQRANITAWDISPKALQTAKENAQKLGARVDFLEQDALNSPGDKEKWNLIVSNPPYISFAEQRYMERNVLDYEPAEALFPPTGEPSLFYMEISNYARLALKHHGMLYFEMNPLVSVQVAEFLYLQGFVDVEIKKDQFGKERFVKAIKP